MKLLLPQNGVAISFYMATKVLVLQLKNVGFSTYFQIGQNIHLSKLIQLPEGSDSQVYDFRKLRYFQLLTTMTNFQPHSEAFYTTQCQRRNQIIPSVQKQQLFLLLLLCNFFISRNFPC